MITKEILHDLYTYNDGSLYYKKIIYGNTRRKIGDKVGYVVNEGYVVAKVKGKSYLVHRLIYMMHYGYMPDQIDHIDNDPANNRIENLRNANGSQNCMNKGISIRNTSGYKNIHYVKKINKWRVQLKVKGKPLSFGCYGDLELADLVAQEVRDRYAGEFARHS